MGKRARPGASVQAAAGKTFANLIFSLFHQAQSNVSCRVEDHRESQVYHVFRHFDAHGISQYSINNSKLFLGFVGPYWEQHIVAELDSALNEWIDTFLIIVRSSYPSRLAY